jgi:hypothetical protein
MIERIDKMKRYRVTYRQFIIIGSRKTADVVDRYLSVYAKTKRGAFDSFWWGKVNDAEVECGLKKQIEQVRSEIEKLSKSAKDSETVADNINRKRRRRENDKA